MCVHDCVCERETLCLCVCAHICTYVCTVMTLCKFFRCRKLFPTFKGRLVNSSRSRIVWWGKQPNFKRRFGQRRVHSKLLLKRYVLYCGLIHIRIYSACLCVLNGSDFFPPTSLSLLHVCSMTFPSVRCETWISLWLSNLLKPPPSTVTSQTQWDRCLQRYLLT